MLSLFTADAVCSLTVSYSGCHVCSPSFITCIDPLVYFYWLQYFKQRTLTSLLIYGVCRVRGLIIIQG